MDELDDMSFDSFANSTESRATPPWSGMRAFDSFANSTESRATLPCSGMRALMLAVLEDAILNLRSSVRRHRAEAESWIMSGERHYVFSFAVICETLDLAPSAVRRSVIRLLNQSPRVGRSSRRARPNVRHVDTRDLQAA